MGGHLSSGYADLTPDAEQRVKKLADAIVEDIAEVYSVGDELGRGRFALVQRLTHLKEKRQYAAKVLENKSFADEENLEKLETEIEILRKLEHPHIVGLKEVVIDKENAYIVMELLGGGELFNRIVDNGPFPEKDAARLFAQIILSVEYLHSLQIVHRDVKPENIMYTAEASDSVKLIDFGYAGVWASDKPLTGLCGTPDYNAPEVLTWYNSHVDGTPYGKASDLWSLGVLLYVILSGCSPFSADEQDEILKRVSAAQYTFHESEFASISADAKDLIAKLLVADPSQRLTMALVIDHPWLKDTVAVMREEVAAAPETAVSQTAGGGQAASSALKQQQAPPARTADGSAPMGGEPTAPPQHAPQMQQGGWETTIEPVVTSVGRKQGSCCTIS